MLTVQSLRVSMTEQGIPPRMQHALAEYILLGRPVGSFLEAVLRNNLKDAVGRADHENIHLIPNYVMFLYDAAPLECWGSEARIEEWRKVGGMSQFHSESATAGQ